MSAIFSALTAYQTEGFVFFLDTSMALDLQADALTSGACGTACGTRALKPERVEAPWWRQIVSHDGI